MQCLLSSLITTHEPPYSPKSKLNLHPCFASAITVVEEIVNVGLIFLLDHGMFRELKGKSFVFFLLLYTNQA